MKDNNSSLKFNKKNKEEPLLVLNSGVLIIGDINLNCFVLENKERVFNKKAMASFIGLKSDGGNSFTKTILQGKGIRSQLNKKLIEKLENPILFKNPKGSIKIIQHGYNAEILVDLCDTLFQARKEGKLLSTQLFLAEQAEILLRAFAKVGVIALIDEATGFIDKDKYEYKKIFDKIIREEARDWSKEFPDIFFDELYRIYDMKKENKNHPQFFSHIINKHVYKPLLRSNGYILKKLKEKNPSNKKGYRKYKLHQFLSNEEGLNGFRQHIWQIIAIYKISKNKNDTEKSIEKIFGKDYQLTFEDYIDD